MKITNFKIITTSIIGLVFFNLFFIYNFNLDIIKFFLSIVYLLFIPGFLFYNILSSSKVEIGQRILFSIGISITFLLWIGLALNTILPIFKIIHPLDIKYLLPTLDIVILLFAGFLLPRKSIVLFEIKNNNINRLKEYFSIIPVLFPFFSIFGVIVLNNNGSNVVSLLTVVFISLYVMSTIIFKGKVYANYPLAIYFISLSLIYLYSLRSGHVLGWDINPEYNFFQETFKNQYWNANYLHNNPYNACLSITIFPTILNLFLRINSEYIFKAIFPLIFSFLPVCVYYITSKIFSKQISFLSAFFFISQVGFLTTIIAVTRQQSSLLFFALLMLTLVDQKITSVKIKFILSLFFGTSMILTHYSTSYIGITILILSYIVSFILKRLLARIPQFKFLNNIVLNTKYNISLILILLTFSCIWFVSVAKISSNFSMGINKIMTSFKTMSQDNKNIINNIFEHQLNLSPKNTNLNAILSNYINSTDNNYKNIKYFNYYPTEKYQPYRPLIVKSEILPNKMQNKFIQITNIIFEFIKKTIEAFMIIGLGMLIYYFKKNMIETEYVTTNIIFIIILFLAILVPSVSVLYNFDRLYQQGLIMLSLVIVFGLYSVLQLPFMRYVDIAAYSFVIIYFLFISGLIQQLTGGFSAAVQFNNSGDHYNSFYTHEAEYESAIWANQHIPKNFYVYADVTTNLKLLAFAPHLTLFEYDIIPNSVATTAYIYLGYENIIKNRIQINTSGITILYQTPNSFLNNNKNLIYNNGDSKIYK